MEKTNEQKRLEESFKRFSEFLIPKPKESPKNPFEDIFGECFKGKKPEKK